jgi:carotenoid 1,2-hydratase
MKMFSDPQKDVRTQSRQSGSYEWWYFDGISSDGRYSFVVIFYEGNPFSTRYNAALSNKNYSPMPEAYPAVSISVYEDHEPIFYSFTELQASDCTFSEQRPFLQIGSHQMEGHVQDNTLRYELTLDETLPNGDAIEGQIFFESPQTNRSLFNHTGDNSTGHLWNLVQPRAEVKANLKLNCEQTIAFEGRGYHDHNTGQEPMRNEFTDWYWGRFHFDSATLVYYVMNRQDTEQHQAWLINTANNSILDIFEDVDLVDQGLTFFGLKTARKIGLRSPHSEVQIQQTNLLDNGPFYQRFKSEAFLRMSEKDIVESQVGISEYIRPDRIYWRIFWPLLNMRIHYKSEGSHWVQRSKTLYRWTW